MCGLKCFRFNFKKKYLINDSGNFKEIKHIKSVFKFKVVSPQFTFVDFNQSFSYFGNRSIICRKLVGFYRFPF